MQVVLARPAHAAQDFPAADGRIAQRDGVGLQVGAVVQFVRKFGRDQLDGGQGVPISCAAAATTPPRCCNLCSRASATCVANRAFDVA
ncbi:hypothetical protein ACFSYD_03625 [Paracoccus aerius]